MTTTMSYGERTLNTIMIQCDRRGIPREEATSVLALIAKKAGISVTAMNASQLKRLNQNLENVFVEYLEGRKRRGGPTGEWPVADADAMLTAAAAGIAIASVEGSGDEGLVTKADVDDAVEAMSDSEDTDL